jgi:very-short-patch-repair endonuclease
MVTGADRQRNHLETNARARRLRKTPTRAEAVLWKLLRDLPQHHFRRQLALGDFVYDFGDHGCRLLIEVDGGIHDRVDVAAQDVVKETAARALGYRVIRLVNDVILKEPGLALGFIAEASHAEPPPTPTPPHKGEGLQGIRQ